MQFGALNCSYNDSSLICIEALFKPRNFGVGSAGLETETNGTRVPSRTKVLPQQSE